MATGKLTFEVKIDAEKLRKEFIKMQSNMFIDLFYDSEELESILNTNKISLPDE